MDNRDIRTKREYVKSILGHGATKREVAGIGHSTKTSDVGSSSGHGRNKSDAVIPAGHGRNKSDAVIPAGHGRQTRDPVISEPCLEKVMKGLADSNTHLIGVYGSNDESKDFLNDLIEKVCRRNKRDHLFDKVLTVKVTEKPDVNKIQDEIARQLGFALNKKSKDERAHELIGKLNSQKKILIILRDLHKGLELGKVGIPYGTDPPGCKILLISTTEDVLCQMNIGERFHIGS